MNDTISEQNDLDHKDMLPEYDFSAGVRGKHYRAYREGHTVKVQKANGTIEVHYFTLQDGAVMLEPDVREYFPDSDTVNETLRALIQLIPTKYKILAEKKENLE